MSGDGRPAAFIGTMLETGDTVTLCDDCMVLWLAAVLSAVTGVDAAPFIAALSDPSPDSDGVGSPAPDPEPEGPGEPIGVTKGGVTVGRSQRGSGARRTGTASDGSPPTKKTTPEGDDQ